MWAVIATLAWSGTLLLATEIAKIIPGPDDQIIAIGGAIGTLAAILLQIRAQETKPAPPPEPTPDAEKFDTPITKGK